jgi:phosphotransferase system HPr (HPr) family protein
VKLVLTQALHARPASLLVRLVARHASRVELRKGERTADARNIIDVLALGAGTGEQIEIEAQGADAETALHAIAELVSRGFSPDLVPEVGNAVVEGVAIGRAVVTKARKETSGEPRGADEEARRARDAVARADEELARLVSALPEREAALFEPERMILREANARIEALISRGTTAESAVIAVLGGRATDLIADARARILDVLAGSDGDAWKIRDAGNVDLVLVTDRLTPSLVASLPANVRAIVAVQEEAGEGGLHTSHAAILARGRGIPVALVALHVASSMADGDEVIVDTTASAARVWVGPSPKMAAKARSQQLADARARESDDRAVDDLSSRLGVEVWVNVGTLQERVPPSARGVGLLRTELLFASRSSAPSEDQQYAALVGVARGAQGKVVTVRLFDAGGDKPVAWLPPRLDERGMALLFAHANVLAAQLRAIARAADMGAMRVLLPLCRSADDVRAVRALAPSLTVGAMIETPEAARAAAAIAGASDFVSIGTNDLAARVLGVARTHASLALHPHVLAVVAEVVRTAHAHSRRVTVCGEVAADPRGSRVLVGLGVDALSVGTARFADVVRTLATTTREECHAAAQAALSETA